jgi:hypothetical protein
MPTRSLCAPARFAWAPRPTSRLSGTPVTITRPRPNSWLHLNATALVEVLAAEYSVDRRGDDRVYLSFVDSLTRSRARVACSLSVTLASAQTILTSEVVGRQVGEVARTLRMEMDERLNVPAF